MDNLGDMLSAIGAMVFGESGGDLGLGDADAGVLIEEAPEEEEAGYDVDQQRQQRDAANDEGYPDWDPHSGW